MPDLRSAAPERFAGAGFEILSGLAVVARHASRSIALTEWRCREHRRSVTTGKHQPWHVLGFVHGGSFRIEGPRGGGVADPASILIFRAGEEYSTSHPGCCGDYGSAIALSPELAAELGEAVARAGGGDPWRAPLRPADARVVAGQHQLLRQLRRASGLSGRDSLAADEALFSLAARALLPAETAPGGAIPSSSAAGRERMASVQEILEDRFPERLRLDELARAVDLSPFELCRQFRRHTGWTVHRYLTHLRVVHGLERLASEASPRLIDVALDLGFDGHSHFTSVFRRWVGGTPSAYRRAASAGASSIRGAAESLPAGSSLDSSAALREASGA